MSRFRGWPAVAVLAGVFLAWSAPQFASAQPLSGDDADQRAVKEVRLRRELVLSLQKKLVDQDFEGLEKFAREQRKSKESLANGERKLHTFYDAMAQAEPNDAAFTARIAQLDKWLAAKPESLAARVALAECYVRYGLFARGAAAGAKVTVEGARLLGERLNTAAGYLDDAEKLEKDPAYFWVFLRIALHINVPPETSQGLLDQALAIDPRYYPAVNARAQRLLPRWGGKPGELETFAHQMALRPGLGAAIYARIVSTMAQLNVDVFVEHNFDADRVRAGYEELFKEFPESNQLEQAGCHIACLLGDMPTARKLFTRLGGGWRDQIDGQPSYQKRIWGTQFNYDRWRMLALGAPGGQRTLVVPHRAGLQTVAFSASGEVLAVGGENGSASVWDAAGKQQVDFFPRLLFPRATALAYSRGDILALCGPLPRFFVQDINSPEANDQGILAFSGLKAAVNSAAFVPDEPSLAIAGMDGVVQIWDLPERKSKISFEAHKGSCEVLAIGLQDPPLLATGGVDGQVRFWTLEGKTANLREFQEAGRVQALAFSPDGNLLAIASGGVQGIKTHGARVWDFKKKDFMVVTGHQRSVMAVAFSPDGKLLATAEGDPLVLAPCEILVWNLDPKAPQNGPREPITRLAGHHAAVRGLAFAPDGKTLASASEDMTLRLWDVPNAK